MLDWLTCFFLARAGSDREKMPSGVPVFTVFVNAVPKGVFWIGPSCSRPWTGVLLASGSLQSSLSPQTLSLGTEALHSSACISLVRLPTVSSGRVPIAPDSELDSKQENQMLLSLPGPDPTNWNWSSATFSLPSAPCQSVELSQWGGPHSRYKRNLEPLCIWQCLHSAFTFFLKIIFIY